MLSKETKSNIRLLLKVGIPFTLLGMAIVFAGLYGVKYYFSDNKYFSVILFFWLAAFWFIYQPLFRKRMISLKKKLREK